MGELKPAELTNIRKAISDCEHFLGRTLLDCMEDETELPEALTLAINRALLRDAGGDVSAATKALLRPWKQLSRTETTLSQENKMLREALEAIVEDSRVGLAGKPVTKSKFVNYSAPFYHKAKQALAIDGGGDGEGR